MLLNSIRIYSHDGELHESLGFIYKYVQNTRHSPLVVGVVPSWFERWWLEFAVAG